MVRIYYGQIYHQKRLRVKRPGRHWQAAQGRGGSPSYPQPSAFSRHR